MLLPVGEADGAAPQPRLATLMVQCPDKKGVVAALGQLLYGLGCNIVESDQWTDADSGTYFQRWAGVCVKQGASALSHWNPSDIAFSGVENAALFGCKSGGPLSLMAELPVGARFRHQACLSHVSPETAVHRQKGLSRGPDCGGGRAAGKTTTISRAGQRCATIRDCP